MWQKIGTPTKRDKSGTVEEINRALKNSTKEKLIYFKTTPPENLNLIDITQLGEIIAYKKELSGKGVLYKEFNSINEFESLFRINLTNLIRERLLNKIDPLPIKASHAINSEKYQAISDLIIHVEGKTEETDIGLDAFELIEQLLSALAMVTSTMQSMTKSTDYLNKRLGERTNELNKYLAIKDDRLRLTKGKIVVNLLADELTDYNNRTIDDMQSFSGNFISIGPTYSKIMQFASNYEIPETATLRNSIAEYRDSIAYAMQQSAAVLKTIMQWPSFTSKFNKSKRETEIVLKDVTKILLEGLKLLDEAVQV